MKKIFVVLVLLIVLVSCEKKIKPIIAFYYWKTTFDLSIEEKEALKYNKISKIYIRYFDVDLLDKTEEPIPITPIHFKNIPKNITIVPVVYIKNKVILKPNLETENLVKKIFGLIKKINKANKISCSEIQIDCDWTLKSKDKYLEFIKNFKEVSGKKLSATIRLHQVKYFEKTKIPDVDSGVLMYYNMGTISPYPTNSIYDQNIAKRYLKSLKKYPLELNFALPIYSWAIQIRNKKVIGLKGKITVKELENNSNFVLIKPNFFRVKNSIYRKGSFYRKDDILKIEAISKDDLLEMASDLYDNSAQQPKEIIFYDLDKINLKNYEKNIFKKVISSF